MENRYTMKQAADLLGVDKMTLYRWEKKGCVSPAKRIVHSNHRFYTDADIERIRAWKDEVRDPATTPQTTDAILARG